MHKTGDAESPGFRQTTQCGNAETSAYSDKQWRSMAFAQFTILTVISAMAAVAEAAEAAEASEAAQTAEAATIAEAAQTAHTAEAAIAEAAEAAESSKTAAEAAEATNAMPDAMMDSCHGDGFRLEPVVGNVVAGAGHGDQTEQKKHSSDLHVDLRRRKAACVCVFFSTGKTKPNDRKEVRSFQ